MPIFCMLASGSSGNAAFLDAGGQGLLIDLGIGPRLLSSRLAVIGKSIRDVHAAILTHTHSDHWKERTLGQLCTHQIPLWCHARHCRYLNAASPSFAALSRAGLIQHFTAEEAFACLRGLTCLPVPIPHDSDPTFAFRIDGSANLFGPAWSLGYAADLGSVPRQLVHAFRDLNVLALEFNHDVEMEKRSGRPWELIARVLGDQGHLSNRQAAALVGALLETSAAARLRHLVQLHLSRQCNRPPPAREAIRGILEKAGNPIELQTATQDVPTKAIDLDRLA